MESKQIVGKIEMIRLLKHVIEFASKTRQAKKKSAKRKLNNVMNFGHVPLVRLRWLGLHRLDHFIKIDYMFWFKLIYHLQSTNFFTSSLSEIYNDKAQWLIRSLQLHSKHSWSWNSLYEKLPPEGIICSGSKIKLRTSHGL